MKKRQVLFLTFVLFVSVKLFAPVISIGDVERSIWNYNRTQMRIKVQEERAKELSKYLDAIGHSESRNNPEAYNRYGYIGKYQFGYITLKSCGYGYICYADFVKNPSIWSEEDQEKAMITLLSKNEGHLRKIIHKYNGEAIKGIVITKSGILAAAHLAGAGGVIKYFKYGYNPKDAYGTRLEDYLIKFSGFNI
jgi:hypothetical protein